MNTELITLRKFADLLIDIAERRPKGSMSREHLKEAAAQIFDAVRAIEYEPRERL